jgi:cellulase
VLRHEIIALQAVNSLDKCQNYQQRVGVAITSSGTANPPSVLLTTFYHETDQGIHIDIYATLTNYTIPGPPLYTAVAGISQTLLATLTASASGVYTVA